MNSNSFQFSFYDIKKKYITSKKILPFQKANIINYYNENITFLEAFSEELINLREKLKKKTNNFDKMYKVLFNQFVDTFNKMKKIDLNLPKKILEKMLNEEKFMIFFCYYIQICIFYIFYFSNDKKADNFCSLFSYFDKIYEKVKNDSDVSLYEKISVLFCFYAIFLKIKSVEIFISTKIEYIKINKIENNSIINLALKFINTFIENLNEDSPSFFKLLEINSSFGYYGRNEIFTFDLLNIEDLKSHLKETIPSIIVFYEYNNSKNLALWKLP